MIYAIMFSIIDNKFQEEFRMKQYTDCKVLCDLKRKSEPLITKVKLDEYTDMVQKNFD